MNTVDNNPKWPADDFAAYGRRDAYYQGMAVCRRKHVLTAYLKPGDSLPATRRCTSCGADIIVACPTCGLRIRGYRYRPRVVSAFAVPAPSFCDGCGAAMPWATRRERIYELENLLDQEGLDEADRVFVADRISELLQLEEQPDERQESKLWDAIKHRAPGFLTGTALPIVQTLITAEARKQLGLPPA